MTTDFHKLNQMVTPISVALSVVMKANYHIFPYMVWAIDLANVL
jgi:hypothetical protein